MAAVIPTWFLGDYIEVAGWETIGAGLNPLGMAEMVQRDGGITEDAQLAFKLLCGVFAASVLVAAPRMLRGVREV